MKFREHRGSLADAMETLVELKDRDALIEHCSKIYKETYFGHRTLDPDKLKVELYADGRPDDRIGWDRTYIVSVEGGGVLGFSDSPIDG